MDDVERLDLLEAKTDLARRQARDTRARVHREPDLKVRAGLVGIIRAEHHANGTTYEPPTATA